MYRKLLRTLWALPVVFMAACGGGGGSAGSSLYGGGSSSTQSVSDVSLTLSSYALSNNGTDSITAKATVVDANRNVIANVPVTFTVDQNAVVVASSAKTDATGAVTGTVSLGSDRSNRAITIKVQVGSLTRTAVFQVTGAKITSSLSLSVAPSSTGNQVTYRVVDVNSNPIVGTDIVISAPGLTTTTGVTDSSGSYSYTYTAPATAGSLTLTAVAAGVQDIQVVQVVTADGTVPAATGTVVSASLSANPNVVPVNTSATSNVAQLRALFVAANNAPIKNIRVRFDLNGDANNIGGTFTSGTSLLYSNDNGIVTGAYKPGTRSSPTDGVTVRACWSYTDFATNTCPNQVLTTLTVTSEPLSVTVGTDELLTDETATLTYLKKFVVSVVDSAGNAKSGVTITPRLDLPGYHKGSYIKGTSWRQTITADCTNEDTDRNGVLTATEDINNDGILEPRAADAAVSFAGSQVTDSTGLVVLQVRYPKNVASWVDFLLTVTATGISGTEGKASYFSVLPVPAETLTNVSAMPAFAVSPYGQASVCTDPK